SRCRRLEGMLPGSGYCWLGDETGPHGVAPPGSPYLRLPSTSGDICHDDYLHRAAVGVDNAAGGVAEQVVDRYPDGVVEDLLNINVHQLTEDVVVAVVESDVEPSERCIGLSHGASKYAVAVSRPGAPVVGAKLIVTVRKSRAISSPLSVKNRQQQDVPQIQGLGGALFIEEIGGPPRCQHGMVATLPCRPWIRCGLSWLQQ